jgi:hypothetical protein
MFLAFWSADCFMKVFKLSRPVNGLKYFGRSAASKLTSTLMTEQLSETSVFKFIFDADRLRRFLAHLIVSKNVSEVGRFGLSKRSERPFVQTSEKIIRIAW